LSSIPGISKTSAIAAELAQPATSYSGAGAASRLATSAATTSPQESCARPR